MNIQNESIGYLTVMVSTARGAIPLEGAVVNVRGDTLDSSEILFSLISDRDGKTPRIPLPTPPKSNSDTPGGASAFSTYNIDVFKDGYVPLYFQNVPIFPSIHSIQPAVMLPSDGSAKFPSENVVTEYPQSSLE